MSTTRDGAGGGREARSWVPAVAPFAVAAIMALAGWRVPAAVVFVLAMVLVQLRVVAPRWARSFDVAAARFGDLVAGAVSGVLLAAAFATVVAPAWLVMRVLGWSPLERAPGAQWHQPGPGAPRVHSGRAFQHEPRTSSVAHRLHGGAVALVLVALVAGVSAVGVRAWRTASTPETAFGAFAPRATEAPSAPVFDDVWVRWQGVPIARENFPGEPHAARLLSSMESIDVDEPDERYGWRSSDLDVPGVHVRDGIRRTVAARAPVEATVWLFGGSTVFGIGQRDGHTIASALVREATRHGRNVQIVNRGVSAYVNDQESDLFTDLLTTEERPDAVVFFDGCNDMAVGFERERYGLLDPEAAVWLAATADVQEQQAEAARAAGWVESHDPDRQARLVAAQYGAGVRRGRAVAARLDIPVAHVWQPILLSMPTDAPLVPTVANNTETALEYFADGAAAYRSALEQSGPGIVDLSDALDNARVPTFFDHCHTNEAGARLQAEALWPVVRDLLDG